MDCTAVGASSSLHGSRVGAETLNNAAAKRHSFALSFSMGGGATREVRSRLPCGLPTEAAPICGSTEGGSQVQR